MTTLALDISSTAIGFVVRDGDSALTLGTIKLKARRLNTRIAMAHLAFQNLLERHAPTAICFEGPAYAGHGVVEQARVVGVLCLLAEQRGLEPVEIPPSSAKKALTGKGNANKELMLMHARGILRDAQQLDEHSADAYGVLLAYEAKHSTNTQKEAA
jgi:Holliday junction resolvasome RuvABC endonuclease subunit